MRLLNIHQWNHYEGLEGILICIQEMKTEYIGVEVVIVFGVADLLNGNFWDLQAVLVVVPTSVLSASKWGKTTSWTVVDTGEGKTN